MGTKSDSPPLNCRQSGSTAGEPPPAGAGPRLHCTAPPHPPPRRAAGLILRAPLHLRLLLHGEAGGLHAELAQLVGARLEVLDVGGTLIQGGAGVGNARALHLQVGQALQVVERQSVGGLRRGKVGREGRLQRVSRKPACRSSSERKAKAAQGGRRLRRAGGGGRTPATSREAARAPTR